MGKDHARGASFGLRPGVLFGLAVTLLALLWSWSRIEGYPLADVVEDLEWTEALLRGERVVDSEATRPFGFFLLLMPLFAVAKLGAAIGLGSEAQLVMHAARIYQLAATLFLVWLTARFAARAASTGRGASAGQARSSAIAAAAAALLLGLNPLVLRWGIEPISGITTGVFVLLSAELILLDPRRGSPGQGAGRRGLLAGLALGAASLTAYKSIAIVAPVFAFALWMGPRRGLSRVALVGGLGACLLAQALCDWLYHGSFGKSLWIYGLQNIGNILPVAMHRVGEWVGSDLLKDSARQLYELGREVHMLEPPPDVPIHESVDDLTSLNPRTWYLTHLHQGLTWPGIALVAVGLGRGVRRRVWPLLVPAAAVTLYVALMSYKGSKDFRLWLPVLSFCAAVGGYGAAAIAGWGRAGWGRAFCWLAVAAAGALGLRAHAGVNQLQFAGYWRAMDWVNSLGEASDRPLRVAAAFHWSVYLRSGSGVELAKLPRHLDGWERHTPVERADSARAIGELDVFISHLALVASRPELAAALADFEVVGGFFHPETETSPGPVFVFRRGAEAGGLLLRTAVEFDPEDWARERDLGAPLGFHDPSELTFLGFEHTALFGDGLGWMTYHWTGGSTAPPLRFLARVTQDDATVWSGDHAPAHGRLGTDAWPAGGWLFSEGYPVLEPWDGDAEWSLWIGAAAADAGGGERLLTAVRPADGVPVLELAPPGAPPSPEGWSTVAAGLVRVGGGGTP